VEGTVAALAAERSDPTDMEALRQLLAKAAGFLHGGASHWEAFVALDRKIHIFIARMAKNTVYYSVVKMVHDNIHHYYEPLPMEEKSELEENYRDLKDIVNAIQDRRDHDARNLTQHHIRRFHRLMMKKNR
jgi:DNA-binding FadR family transcriptional regulator